MLNLSFFLLLSPSLHPPLSFHQSCTNIPSLSLLDLTYFSPSNIHFLNTMYLGSRGDISENIYLHLTVASLLLIMNLLNLHRNKSLILQKKTILQSYLFKTVHFKTHTYFEAFLYSCNMYKSIQYINSHAFL